MHRQCVCQAFRGTAFNLLTYICASDWSSLLGFQGLQHKTCLGHALSHCSCLTRVCDRLNRHLAKVDAADAHEGVMLGSGRSLDVVNSGNSNKGNDSKRTQQEALDREPQEKDRAL